MPERALKVLISAVLAGAFAAVGVYVALARPFDALGGLGRASGRSRGAPRAPGELPVVPEPPDSELTLSVRAGRGSHERYESRLSMEGLALFYEREMPARGWEAEGEFEPAARAGPPGCVLCFRSAGARCIIGMQDSGQFRTAVNVIVVASPPERPEGS